MGSPAKPVHEDQPIPDTGREASVPHNDSQPDVPFPSGRPESEPTQARYQITCKTEKDWWDKAKPLLEMGGLAALVCYATYTVKMYEANKQAADAAKLAAESSYAQLFLTKRQVDSANEAAQKSLTATIEQFRLEQRAWVGWTSGSPVPPGINETTHYAFFVNIRNVGRSPARQVETCISRGMFPQADLTSVPNCWNEPATEGQIHSPSVIVIIPGSDFVLRPATYRFRKDDIQNIQKGVKTFALFGQVRYKDVSQRPHVTDICFKMGHDLTALEPCSCCNDAN